MDPNLIQTSIEIPKWLYILLPLVLSGGILTLIIEDVKSAADSMITKVKKPVKSKQKKQLSNRLNNIIAETNRTLYNRENTYTKLGKETPIDIQLQKAVITTLYGDQGALNIVILIVGFILAIAVTVISFRYLNVVAVLTGISTLAITVMMISMRTTRNQYNMQRKALSVLTVLHAQYQNCESFIMAVTLARDIFQAGTYEYKVVNNYYDRVQHLNMDRHKALQMLVQDLDNNTHIRQYMELVEQAENIDSSYKNALEGIPGNLKNSLDNRNQLVMNIITTSYFMAASLAVIIYKLVISYTLNPQSWQDLIDIGGKQFVIIGSILFTLLSLILTYSNRVKERESWGNK